MPLLLLGNGPGHDAPGQIAEHQAMQRRNSVPVNPATQASGQKMGRLHQPVFLDVEFQPRLARHLHLGQEQQPLVFSDIRHLPEIQGITVTRPRRS